MALARPVTALAPTFDDLMAKRWQPAAPLDRMLVSRLFYFSLALSAWKQVAGSPPWSLRVNPSSGALHPTEGYLVAGPVEGLSDAPGVYHYAPFSHALEQRRILSPQQWRRLAEQLPPRAIIVGLASVYWRESWKYGERAFRYCHHDVGHAIAAVASGAATLGWETRLVPGISDAEIASLIGVAGQQGPEAEHPDCLLAVFPAGHDSFDSTGLDLGACVPTDGANRDWLGSPNVLSRGHHPWPIIDDVADAARVTGNTPAVTKTMGDEADRAPGASSGEGLRRADSAQAIIRRRRSAVAMDGQSALSREAFYHMLRRTLPGEGCFPFDVLPWAPAFALAVFAHRVSELPTGLYLLVRYPRHRHELARILSAKFAWQKPPGCPSDLEFYLLVQGDCREAARLISCQQDIAADGAFSLAMLGRLEPALATYGAWFYPRLFWEAGLIGQVLYLEAEAAGMRATGIGCYFDDVMHELLGISGTQWQSFYHFTVGAAVEDPRLQTLDAYYHLDP